MLAFPVSSCTASYCLVAHPRSPLGYVVWFGSCAAVIGRLRMSGLEAQLHCTEISLEPNRPNRHIPGYHMDSKNYRIRSSNSSQT